MVRLVLVVGLLAGLTAGLATAVLQHFTTVPLIIAAETYEVAEGVAGHDHAPGTADLHPHAAASTESSDGLSRTVSTLTVTIASGIGFSLLLIGVMLLAGEAITPLSALAYAAAGFAATGLATGLGLAPELPGSAAGDLVARQGWWVFTALATAGGLFAMLKLRTPLAIGIGLLLVVAPHVIGAPQPATYASAAPAELAAHFASSSLVMHAAFWALVGTAVGVVWQRIAPT
jgi:cobalt transporter subunit CbtA